MNLAAILELLKQAIGGFDKIGDKGKWSVLSVQHEGKSVKGTIDEFLAEPKGLSFSITFGEGADAKSLKLAAEHYSTSKARVLVNGERDEDARLVFAFKGTLTNPSRWAFDFKNVTVDGEDYRINLRFDP